jgi:hypothetical protein
MSTNREKFLKKHGLPSDYSPTVREIAKLSDMPVQALRRVYQKGLGAYHTNPTSVRMKGSYKKNVEAPMSQKLSPQTWAYGRIYAFVMKTKKVFYEADREIAEEFGLLDKRDE